MILIIRLNPCFDGRWSLTDEGAGFRTGNGVLILVLVEDGL